MLDKMKNLWEMKKKIDRIKADLDDLTIESEDNMVRVSVSGTQEIKSISVKPELSGIDKPELEESLKDTVNRALRQSQKAAAEKMENLGLDLPSA